MVALELTNNKKLALNRKHLRLSACNQIRQSSSIRLAQVITKAGQTNSLKMAEISHESPPPLRF